MPNLKMAIALATVLAAPTPCLAQDWPARPMTMVVPFSAGGGVDVLGRILAPQLSELLGQRVIVENVGGAGGMTGAARVAKAPPDGYQFVLGTVGTHAQNQSLYKNPLYNAGADFAPVALIAEVPILLAARKDLPVNDLREFISYAKANQAKMQYASSGSGAANHLACALLNIGIGVEVTHVPYRAGIATYGVQDMIAGRIDYMCPLVTGTIPQMVESKTVKALATLTKNRSSVLPDVPSAHEQGLSNFEAGTWGAVFLPKRTPTAVVKRLHGAILTAMNTPAVQIRLKAIGADLVTAERRSPEYLQRFVESEIAKWADAIKAAGIALE